MARFTIVKDSRHPGEVLLREQNPSVKDGDRQHIAPEIKCADVEEAYTLACERGHETDTIFWAHVKTELPIWVWPERVEELRRRGVLQEVALGLKAVA